MKKKSFPKSSQLRDQIINCVTPNSPGTYNKDLTGDVKLVGRYEVSQEHVNWSESRLAPQHKAREHEDKAAGRWSKW